MEQLCSPGGLLGPMRGKRGDVNVCSKISSFDGDSYLPHFGALFPRVLQMCLVKHIDLKFNNYEMNPIIKDTFLLLRVFLVKSWLMVVPPCTPASPSSLVPWVLPLLPTFVEVDAQVSVCIPLAPCWY